MVQTRSSEWLGGCTGARKRVWTNRSQSSGKESGTSDTLTDDDTAEPTETQHSKQKRARLSGHSVRETTKKRTQMSKNDSFDKNGRRFANGCLDKTAAEPGVIEFVSLRNFMCHDRLEIRLDERINFIVGLNGSGKSAILTAIVLGLGGRSHATLRGNSAKQLIKTGRKSAEIVLHLRNEGFEAYKPEKYGSRIVIERKITPEHSSYLIKNFKGEIVSRKKEEVDEITTCFNIQVGNPINILNQETSRNFLHSKSSKDKYQFFIKASQLAAIKTSYVESINSVNQAKESLDCKTKCFHEMLQDVKRLADKCKLVGALEKLQIRTVGLENELAWCMVRDKDLEIGRLCVTINEEDATLSEYEQKLIEARTTLTEAEIHVEKIGHDIRQLVRGATDLLPNKLQFEHNIKLFNQKIVEIKENLEKLKEDSKATLQEHDLLINKIHDLKTDPLYAAELKKKKDRNTILSNLMIRLKDYEKELSESQAFLSQYEEKLFNLGEELATLTLDIHKLETGQTNTINEVDMLRKCKTNHLLRFGHRMPGLLKDIDKAHRKRLLKKKPIGPLGRYVCVEEARWTRAVEECLGPLLFTFCVDCAADANQLQKIIHQHFDDSGNVTPSVVIQKFCSSSKADSGVKSEKRPPGNCEFLTVEEVIKVSCPTVRAVILSHRSVDCVALFNEYSKAVAVMVKNPPDGYTEAFTEKGDQIFPFPNFRFYSANECYKNVLTHDINEAIEEAGAKLVETKKNLKSKVIEINIVEDNLKEKVREQKECKETVSYLKETIRESRFKVEDLQSEKDCTIETINCLEEDEKWYSKRTVKLSSDREQLLKELEILRGEKDAYQIHLYKKEKEISEIEMHKLKLLQDFETAENVLKSAKKREETTRMKVQELHERMTSRRKLHNNLKAEITAMTQKAFDICPKIHSNRSTNSLQIEIDMLKREIDEQLQDKDKSYLLQEMKKVYREKLESVKTFRKELTSMRILCADLESNVLARLASYSFFEEIVSERVKLLFIELLSKGNIHGRLAINHVEEELDIIIYRDQGDEVQLQDLRSLSGGERSFATVCLLLALWQSVEAPFRILDEFDVFMDSATREKCLEMIMVLSAEMGLGKQLVFITPQNMSGSQWACPVTVYHLQAPKRIA